MVKVYIWGQRVHPQKANLFQTVSPKKKAFEPMGKFTGKTALGLGRYIHGVAARATEKTDELLKKNLMKAVLRSGLPSWARYALADKITSMSARKVAELYYSNDSINFEYIYSDEEVEKKIRELFLAFDIDIDKTKRKVKERKRYEAIAEGLDKVKAAKNYPTTWWRPGKFGIDALVKPIDDSKTPWD